MNRNRQELFLKYTQEIHQTYRENSLVPVLTTIQKEEDTQALGFVKIGKRFLVPQEFFEVNHVIIMRPFADFIELSEYQYIIDTMKETHHTHARCRQSPDYQIINEAIETIIGITEPNFIILPLAFFVSLHEGSRRPDGPPIRYDNDRHPYYVDNGSRLRILWSNKYIKLNEMIIGNSRDSLWLFKSNDDERLKVEFVDVEQGDVTLLVETVFRYQPPPPDRLSVTEFPEELCRI